MGERKGTNKYYPPDFDPSKGGLNKYHGTHALRERARKLHEGILIIRFEMPYNIWCNGCGNHIGMGVRYNAQKRKIGNFYSTPIYKFRMKCHLCDQHFEIRTDPEKCDYEILSGCRRKEERWDTQKAGNVQSMDRKVKQKMMENAMFKLEHESNDKLKSIKIAPTLSRLEEIRTDWKDDFSVNQLLRKKFRDEKKEIKLEQLSDDAFKESANLSKDLVLLKESTDDIVNAKKIRYGEDLDNPQKKIKFRRHELKKSSIFSQSPKQQLASTLISKKKRRLSGSNVPQSVTPNPLTNLGVVIKKSNCGSSAKDESKNSENNNHSQSSTETSSNTLASTEQVSSTLENKKPDLHAQTSAESLKPSYFANLVGYTSSNSESETDT